MPTACSGLRFADCIDGVGGHNGGNGQIRVNSREGVMAPQQSDARVIKVTCKCGKRLGFPHIRIGKSANCPSCKRALRIITHGDGSDARAARGGLLIQKGPHHAGELVFLAGRLPIEAGKRSNKDLHLEGDLVSRDHCRLVPTDAGWRIEDCSSTNGLFVNGQRITGHDLKHGDRIRIGEYELTYLRVGAAKRKAPSTPKEPAAAPAPPLPSEMPQEPPPEDEPSADETYQTTENPVEAAPLVEQQAEPAVPATTAVSLGAGGVVETEETGEAPICPSCQKQLRPKAKICVDCGIDIETGRALLTSQETGLDGIYIAAESIIRVVSWVFWVGFYPIASEAFGTRKPYTTRAIAIVTVLVSFWFLAYEWSSSPRMRTMKNLMLWAGDAEPDPDMLFIFYTFTEYGDKYAFGRKLAEQEASQPELSDKDQILAAHNALAPEQQCLGKYQSYQLITHAFLHGGIVHLIGNLIFLLVFGSRVNALIGNVLTVLLYPALAIGAGLAQMASMSGQPPVPMIGASGAVMGLAGMYMVLFPVNQVHMAAWVRWGLIGGFQLSLKMWAVKGFWVVLFYIGFDVAYTIYEIEDAVAHWAHLGGFGVGAAIGLLLLLTRLVNARGGDLISAMFGRQAWALIGRPSHEVGILQRLP